MTSLTLPHSPKKGSIGLYITTHVYSGSCAERPSGPADSRLSVEVKRNGYST